VRRHLTFILRCVCARPGLLASKAFSIEVSRGHLNILASITCDQTGVGDYIVEDMKRAGVRNVEGVTFTETSKEAMATSLRENMRRADCPSCGWSGHIEDVNGDWRSTCPDGCSRDDECPVGLRPQLHIPYDPELFAELNVERFELNKSGKILFNHPEGTNDDRFWAAALAVYSITEKRMNKPIADETVTSSD